MYELKKSFGQYRLFFSRQNYKIEILTINEISQLNI